MRSDEWTPAWVAENRLPSFVGFGSSTFSQEFEQRAQGRDEFSSGISLYASSHFTTIVVQSAD